MFVKICGTTNLRDAKLAIELGADALGFIFAPSTRRVEVQEAAAITRELPMGVERVGVFVEPDLEEIGRAVREAGLSAVQMHWPYTPARVAELRSALGEAIELWQFVGFEVSPENEDAAERSFTYNLRSAMLDPRLSVVLLDTVKRGASGGLGETFSWWRVQSILKAARLASRQVEKTRGEVLPRLMLAGGLTAENVRDAIAAIRPSGVDAVSGVEAQPGIKSEDRMKSFLAAAHETEATFPPLR